MCLSFNSKKKFTIPVLCLIRTFDVCPLFVQFLGTDLKRIRNGGGTDLKRDGKKSSLVVCLCHNSKSVVIPLWIRYDTVHENRRKMGFARDLLGIWIGATRIKQISIISIISIKFVHTLIGWFSLLVMMYVSFFYWNYWNNWNYSPDLLS